MVWSPLAWVDDIDIYRHGSGVGDPWVHVLLDFRGLENDKILCTVGVDCQPPFLSKLAYEHLRQTHKTGEPAAASAVLRAILLAVISSPHLENLRLSLLMPNHPANSSAAGDGGATVLAGYSRLGSSREHVLEDLRAIPLDKVPFDQALQPRKALYEWYRYLSGGPVALGMNTSGNFGEAAPFPDYDPAIVSNGRYIPPVQGEDTCPRLYGVIALLGVTGPDTDLDAEIYQSFGIADAEDPYAFMAMLHHPETDLLPSQKASARVLGTLVIATREQSDAATSLALAGGSGSPKFLEDPRETEAALHAFLERALESDASLVSPTVAGDVFRRGSLLDRYYLPLFQSSGGERWRGNVKKYRLNVIPTGSTNDTMPALVDARGMPAIEWQEDHRGRLAFDALSFWTDTLHLSPGDGVTVPVDADGRVVDRGGAGQKIDGFINRGTSIYPVIGDLNAGGETPTRQVFVEPSEPGPLIPFNADADTLAKLRDELDPRGERDDTELLDTIRWARGQDIDNGSGGPRHWLMGGVIHSRPLAINYGATTGYTGANQHVRLFFGTTDGLFHVIEDTNILGQQSGRERFAIYPIAMLRHLSALQGSINSPGDLYGVDGAPIALRVDKHGDGTIQPEQGDEVYVYVGLRRGGRGYLAFDVSDPEQPPRLAWSIEPHGDFEELGLSFSTPVVGKVKFESLPRDVLIFAGGYHGGWNEDKTARIGKDSGYEDDPLGNAVFIVDARTGELIWKAVRGTSGVASDSRYQHSLLRDSIPSQLTALRTPRGIIHRLYVGDTGGAIWRIDVPPGDAPGHRRENWFVSRLADLGSDPGEPGGAEALDLRFFHPPEVVRSVDAYGEFDGVIIQSGDRAHPLETTAKNYLFYIKDRQVSALEVPLVQEKQALSAGTRYQFADLPDQTGCAVSTDPNDPSSACPDRTFPQGWKMAFSLPGEKGLSTPLVDGGRVLATTYVPGVDQGCTPREGRGRLHAVRLADAAPLSLGTRVHDLGSGIPPAPMHLGEQILLPGGRVDLRAFEPDTVTRMTQLVPTAAPQRYRAYWRAPSMDSP